MIFSPADHPVDPEARVAWSLLDGFGPRRARFASVSLGVDEPTGQPRDRKLRYGIMDLTSVHLQSEDGAP